MATSLSFLDQSIVSTALPNSEMFSSSSNLSLALNEVSNSRRRLQLRPDVVLGWRFVPPHDGGISANLGKTIGRSYFYFMTVRYFSHRSLPSQDIFGRKQTLLASAVFFLLGSLACAVAQTMTQLIVFRGVAGIGGGGGLQAMHIVNHADSSRSRPPDFDLAHHLGCEIGFLSVGGICLTLFSRSYL